MTRWWGAIAVVWTVLWAPVLIGLADVHWWSQAAIVATTCWLWWRVGRSSSSTETEDRA